MNIARSVSVAVVIFAFVFRAQAGDGPTVQAQGPSPVVVRDAWVRKPAGDRRDTALFATVENHGTAAKAIVRASADIAEKTELHEMKMSGGMMRMSPVASIVVPAHGSVDLKPGGLHVMLFGLRKTPMAGDAVTLTLTFDDGSTVVTRAEVRQEAGMRGNGPVMPAQ